VPDGIPALSCAASHPGSTDNAEGDTRGLGGYGEERVRRQVAAGMSRVIAVTGPKFASVR